MPKTAPVRVENLPAVRRLIEAADELADVADGVLGEGLSSDIHEGIEGAIDDYRAARAALYEEARG